MEEGPEFRHLVAFVTVAEECSFGKAAQRLHITQPTLSGQIKQLEGWLGSGLFKRVPQGAELTQKGRNFLPYARRLLHMRRHAINLTSGFNIILADRTKESTKKDTRNGLGKSTFIDVIHFCLGGKLTSSSSRLAYPMLSQYSFSLELDLNGHVFTVTRRVDSPTFVTLSGDVADLPLPEDRGKKSARLSIGEWIRFLGQYWLGVPVDTDRKYAPSFRSAISYFIRSDKDAFSDPFRHFRLQASWDIQVNNAFLLGLDWEDASDWQVLKDRRKAITSLQEAARGGILGTVLGSRGQLEAERIRLTDLVKRTKEDLAGFRVLSQYRELEREADELSRSIKTLSDENTVDTQALEMYQRSVREVVESSAEHVRETYRDATVAYPEVVTRRLEEVEAFHQKVVENRRQFLLAETDRLHRDIERRKAEIDRKHERQVTILTLLNTHGALDQYSKLQQAHSDQLSRLREIEAKLAAVKRLEQEKAELKSGWPHSSSVPGRITKPGYRNGRQR